MSARSLAWSVRRELWEHRAIVWGPVLVAVIAVFAMLVNSRRFVNSMILLVHMPPDRGIGAVAAPFAMAGAAVLATGWIIGVFYCIEALHAERRDRSILFWKSMPVSDAETVASKVLVALGALPLLSMVTALMAQLLLLLTAVAILALFGGEATPSVLTSRLPMSDALPLLAWTAFTHSLWYAPNFAYLLLVSAWSKRAPFLWAFLPIFAAMLLEKLAFDTNYVTQFLRDRINGAASVAFSSEVGHVQATTIAGISPGSFFSSLTLWFGLAAAAGMVACAVLVRRNREPG